MLTNFAHSLGPPPGTTTLMACGPNVPIFLSSSPLLLVGRCCAGSVGGSAGGGTSGTLEDVQGIQCGICLHHLQDQWLILATVCGAIGPVHESKKLVRCHEPDVRDTQENTIAQRGQEMRTSVESYRLVLLELVAVILRLNVGIVGEIFVDPRVGSVCSTPRATRPRRGKRP